MFEKISKRNFAEVRLPTPGKQQPFGRNIYDGMKAYVKGFNIVKEGQGYLSITPHRATYRVNNMGMLLIDRNGYLSIDFVPP